MAKTDFDRVRELNLPVRIVCFSANAAEFVLQERGRKIVPDNAELDLVGFVALSLPGLDAVRAFRDYWSVTSGTRHPRCLI